MSETAHPDRRPHVAALVVLVCAVLLVAVLVTRGAPVEVAVPEGSASPGCDAAAARWPAVVAGSETRDTDPQDPAVRAWGDPAVIARCGVPALGPTTEQCIAVGGVDWVAEPLSDGTRLTTYGRDPAVEVLVPESAGPAPLLLPAFAEVARALPANDRACS